MINNSPFQPVIEKVKDVKTNQSESSIAAKIANWVLVLAVALLPVLVIPLTTSFILDSKMYLLFFTGIIISVLYFLNSFKDKTWKIIISPITLPLIFFGAVAILSTFLTQSYPVENLLGLGGVYIISVIISIFGASIIDKKKSNLIIPVFTGAICLLNIASLLQLFGIGPSHLVTLTTGFELDHSIVFNLAGGSFIATQLGILALVGIIAKIFSTKKVGTFEVIALPLLVFGIGLHIWSMLPGQPAQTPLPPFASSWSVALDSLRVPRAAIIGQGPMAYLSTFSRYRPTSLNITPYWQLRFESGLGTPLTILVQMGILGIISWLLLAGRFVFKISKDQAYKSSPLTWVIIASFAMQFFLPFGLLMVGLQGILLAFWTAQHKNSFSVLKLRPLSANLDGNRVDQLSSQKNQADKWISLITNGAMVAGLLFVAFITGKSYASFHNLYLAEKGRADNDVVKLYEHTQKAMLLNPYLDSIRRTYALTNVQIALALSEKTDPTEEEQQQVSSLVEQAVREAQASTTIDPQDSQNWLVLAQIYQELIGSVEEADQWAVNAYVSAIQTDPSNPFIRIQLGNILLQQEQIQQAASLFSQAIELKPDLASGHFYLGQVYQLAQDPISAKNSWQQALALLEPGTEDYEALEGMLEELQPEVEAAEEQLAQQQEMAQQYNQDGQPVNQDEQVLNQGTSPLGQQLPSLTDQNIESRDEIVSQTNDAPLELPEEEAPVNTNPETTTQPPEEI